MKIVLAGGTGQVGTLLARAFGRDGHEVIVLSRRPQPAPWRVVPWDAATLGPWSAELDGADVVVNLAGRNVNCRYTPANRRAIMDSRVQSTTVIGQAIARAARPPYLWLQASTATIYAHRYDAANDEATGLLGGGEPGAPDTWRFSIQVAQAWEAALNAASVPRTRRVALRSAMIMDASAGGIFATLLNLVRAGLGGTAGDGRQYLSWVHAHDFVRALQWLIAHEELDGAVNIAAPQPLPNAEFMRTLRAAWGQPIGLPAAPWMLELGALVLQTETELILKSRRVVSGRLSAAGFEFAWPTWAAAARDLCESMKRGERGRMK